MLDLDGEKVALTELLHSVQQDIVKIEAHSHPSGVAAEYEWLRRRYPNSKRIKQSLVAFEVPDSSSQTGKREVYFDLLDIELVDGSKKQLYFDISSFFNGAGSSLIDPAAFMAKKIAEMYRR